MKFISVLSILLAFAKVRSEYSPESSYGSPNLGQYNGDNGNGLFENDNGYDYNGFTSYGNGYDSGTTFVHKHIYVHVPPPEFEEDQQETKPITVPPNEKHYKIIFIKAPNPPSVSVPSIPPLPQKEEKTLVYVLVKKPEDTPEIKIPTPPPTVPSKPEVYFIRYKAKTESGNAEDGQSNDYGQNDNTGYGQNDNTGYGQSASSGSGGDLNGSSEYGPLKQNGY